MHYWILYMITCCLRYIARAGDVGQHSPAFQRNKRLCGRSQQSAATLPCAHRECWQEDEECQASIWAPSGNRKVWFQTDKEFTRAVSTTLSPFPLYLFSSFFILFLFFPSPPTQGLLFFLLTSLPSPWGANPRPYLYMGGWAAALMLHPPPPTMSYVAQFDINIDMRFRISLIFWDSLASNLLSSWA